MVNICFTDAAIDDLRRLGPAVVSKVLRKILVLLTDPKAGYPLGGELTGYRKLVVGRNTWRVVYRMTEDEAVEICEIWAVGPRADAEVYAEATARVRAAAGRPEFAQLAEVLERLGRLVGDIAMQETTQDEPVPDWLAHRLIHTVGIGREQVAALSLQEAVDLWAGFMARPS